MPSDWERLSADPALLEEVRRRYRGRGDAADQLWWLANPGKAGPSGEPDPSAALQEARLGLYRRGAAPGRAAALADEQVLLDADRRLAQDALAEALEERSRSAAGPFRAGAGARLQRPRTLLAALVGALLLAGGFALGRAAVPPGPAAAAHTARAYRVLARPQAAPDRIPGALRPAFVRAASTRLLASYGSIGTEVYGARATDGRLCLLVVVLGAKPVGTCTTETGFSAAGLFVEFGAQADPVDDSGRRPSEQIGLLWMPDGTLTVTV